MNIAGSGSLPGGEYNDAINISGSGKIMGNVSCTEFTASGSGTVNGDLRCQGNVKISGSGSIKGNLDAMEVSISGSGKVQGELACEKCSVSGMAHAGSFMTNSLPSSGMLSSDGDITAEDAVFHGAVSAGGLINAEKLEIVFDANSKAASVGGSSIRIRRKGIAASLFSRLIGRKSFARMQVEESIEGDVIDVEYVTADSVVGKSVKIGPGCKIGTVIYAETVEVSPEAEVGTCLSQSIG